MAPGLLTVGAVCTSLALICGIASLSTTNWMTACIDFDDILEAYKTLTGASSTSSIVQSLNALKGSTICYNSGLFAVAVEMPAFHVSKSFKFQANPNDTFLHAVAGLIICGLLLLFVSVGLLFFSASSRSVNYERKLTAKSYARIAVGTLILGNVLYTAGMITYAVEQSKVVHSYQGYLAQIGPSFYGSMSAIPGFGGGNGVGSQSSNNNYNGGNLYPNSNNYGYNPDGTGRKRRQTDLDHPYEEVVTGLSPGHYPINAQQQQQALEILKSFKNMDPVFGYSFYIAWFGFGFALLALVFSFMAAFFCARSPSDYDTQPLPVL